MTTNDTLRFDVPLYTASDAARIVRVPSSTLATWAKGYVRRSPGRPEATGDPVITYIDPERPRAPVIPFVGLAEAMVLAAVRRSGVPMQRIRPVLEAIEDEISVDHAEVVADPTRAVGAPIFERGGVRVSDVLERFWSGESLDDLSDDFGVPLNQLEDVLRVASRRAA